MKKHTIVMNDDQWIWLIKRLNLDWDEEVVYQIQNGAGDIEYLKELYDVYEALLGKADNFIEAYVIIDDLESKQLDMKTVKEALR